MANWPYLRHDRGRTGLGDYAAGIGSLIWQFTPAANIYITAPPVISPSGFIYVLAEGFGDGQCHLYRLNPVDGSVVWQVTTSRLSSVPQEPTCLSDDAVMIGVREHVYCYNSDSTLRWDFNPASGGGGNLPIELDSGDLAVLYENFGPTTQHLATIKASDASTVTDVTISPVLANQTIALTTDGTDLFLQEIVAGVASLRRRVATTGAIVWTATLTGTDSFFNGPVVRFGNYVIVQSRVGLSSSLTLSCVDYATGGVNWTAPSEWGAGFYGRDLGLAPSTDGVYVYHQLTEVNNGDGTFTETLEALDITNGASVWTQTAVAQDQNDNRSAVPSIGNNGELYWDIDGVQLIRTSDGAIIGNVARSVLWGTNPDTTHNCFIHNPSLSNGYFLQDGGGTGQATFGIGTRPSIFAFATSAPPVTQFGRASEVQSNFGAVPSTATQTVVIPFVSA